MALNNAMVQVCVIGMLAFCGPGMFNALNGLGAAGSGDAKTAAVTNGCLYLTFSIVGYFAGSIFNVLGPRWSFTIGGVSYAIYALCVYYGTVSIILPGIGGFQLGIGAGIFWCAQMALCIAYATENNNSQLMSVFWVIFNLGGVFGGFLQMGLNWSLFEADSGGVYSPIGNKASAAGYFTFVVIMLISPVLAWTLLVSPKNVIKADGTSPQVKDAEPFTKELKDAAKGFVDPFVLKMMIYFIFSNWFYTYEFGYLNAQFFNSRFAGLNSGLYWGAQMLGATMLPFFTDNKKWSAKKRAWSGLYLNIFFIVISWILAFVIQYTSCNGLVDKDNGNVDMTFPYAGENKVVAWFPDVCEQFPEIDRMWGEGACSDGCEFLRLCRLTLKDAQTNGSSFYNDNVDFYKDTGTPYICDAFYPRCANNGSDREVPKMVDDVCGDDDNCFNNLNADFYSDHADFTGADFTGPEERSKCMLDVTSGDHPVCSTVYYSANVDGVKYRAKTDDAETLCEDVSNMPEDKVSPLMPSTDDSDLAKMSMYIGDDGEWFSPMWTPGNNTDWEALKTKMCNVQLKGICKIEDEECVLVDGGQDVMDEKYNFAFKCLTLDVSYSSQSALIVVDYFLMGISDAIFQVYVLWLIGAMAGGELSLAARYSAAYKGIQSAGAAVAWLTDLIDGFTYRYQSYVCIVFGVVAMIGAAITIPMFTKVQEDRAHRQPIKGSRSSSNERVKSAASEDKVSGSSSSSDV